MPILNLFEGDGFDDGVFPRKDGGVGNIPRSDWSKVFKVRGTTPPLLILSGSAHWGLAAKNQVVLGFEVIVTKLPASSSLRPLKFKLWTHGFRDNDKDTAHFPLTTVHKLITDGAGDYKIEMIPIDGTHVSESDIFSGHLIDLYLAQ